MRRRQESCSGGEWVNCNAPAPEIETCDTLDNDCDGQFDENVVQTCDLPAELSMCANPMGIQRCLEGAGGRVKVWALTPKLR